MIKGKRSNDIKLSCGMLIFEWLFIGHNMKGNVTIVMFFVLLVEEGRSPDTINIQVWADFHVENHNTTYSAKTVE